MKRAQNRIAESRYALLITAILCGMTIALRQLCHHDPWMNIAVIAVATLLMVYINNSNALIRIHSRMVSCAFMVLSTTVAMPAFDTDTMGALICFLLAVVVMLKTYQEHHAPGLMLYSYAFMGIGTVFNVHLMFFVPVMLILNFTYLQAGSIRNLMASLLGLILPYWFIAGYYVYKNSIDGLDAIAGHFTQLASFGSLPDFTALSTMRIANIIFIALLGLTGSFHFIRNSYKDKIKTRMIFETFIMLGVITLVFIILQPVHYELLTGIMIICTSPLIGHFIALTSTKLTNMTFFTIIAMAVILTALNIWMH